MHTFIQDDIYETVGLSSPRAVIISLFVRIAIGSLANLVSMQKFSFYLDLNGSNDPHMATGDSYLSFYTGCLWLHFFNFLDFRFLLSNRE